MSMIYICERYPLCLTVQIGMLRIYCDEATWKKNTYINSFILPYIYIIYLPVNLELDVKYLRACRFNINSHI